MGIRCVNSRSCGMSHQRHANLLQDAGFHQSSIEGMAEIVKTDMPDAGALKRGFPGAFHDADRAAAEIDHETLWFAVLNQVVEQPLGQRDLA